jgi:Kef-type K+ transport system membrane component KefB
VSRVFGLLVLILLMGLLVYLPADIGSAAPLSMLLGFLLLAGFVLGKIGNNIGLPGITGYLLAGMVLGPSCFGILDRKSVADLQLINSFALTLIALTAGGEVNLRRLYERLRSFLAVIFGQVVVTFCGVLVSMTLLLSFLPGPFAGGTAASLVVASLFAVVALANSPSSTVAVIVETGARGKVSEMVLGVTIVKDLVVIVAFALAMSAGFAVLQLGGGTDGSNLMAGLAWEIGGSILCGVLLGLGIIAYMAFVAAEIPVFIIALSFISSKLSSLLGLHPLLVCMVAGLVVNNLSSRGREFIQAIEKGSLPIYVVFFAIAGADLDLGVIAGAWQLVLLLVVSRSIFTWLGTWAGSVVGGEEDVVRENLWLGFFAQAGVTLGMAVIVADTFPGWGTTFKNVVVGAIAVFQLAGPVLLKYSLARAGEIRPQ